MVVRWCEIGDSFSHQILVIRFNDFQPALHRNHFQEAVTDMFETMHSDDNREREIFRNMRQNADDTLEAAG